MKCDYLFQVVLQSTTKRSITFHVNIPTKLAPQQNGTMMENIKNSDETPEVLIQGMIHSTWLLWNC